MCTVRLVWCSFKAVFKAEVGSEDLTKTKIVVVQTLSERAGRGALDISGVYELLCEADSASPHLRCVWEAEL